MDEHAVDALRFRRRKFRYRYCLQRQTAFQTVIYALALLESLFLMMVAIAASVPKTISDHVIA